MTDFFIFVASESGVREILSKISLFQCHHMRSQRIAARSTKYFSSSFSIPKSFAGSMIHQIQSCVDFLGDDERLSGHFVCHQMITTRENSKNRCTADSVWELQWRQLISSRCIRLPMNSILGSDSQAICHNINLSLLLTFKFHHSFFHLVGCKGPESLILECWSTK